MAKTTELIKSLFLLPVLCGDAADSIGQVGLRQATQPPTCNVAFSFRCHNLKQRRQSSFLKYICKV